MKTIRLLEYLGNYFAMTDQSKVMAIQEAISELEALQQPKNCDGCKFHDDVGWDDWCCDCIRKWTIDRYEAKEQ